MQDSIVMAKKGVYEYFKAAKKDFFTPYILKLAFGPYIVAFIVFSIIFYYFSPTWYEIIFNIMRYDFSFSSVYLAWIQVVFDNLLKVSVVILLFFLFLAASFLLSYAICAFVAPFVIKFIQKNHYKEILLENNVGIFEITFKLIKIYFLYILFLFVLIPFYFLPFVGGFVILLPNYWLFAKSLVLDSGGEIFKKEQLESIKKANKGRIQSVILPLFALSLIPILGFFVPIFALCVLAHLFFDLKKEFYGYTNTN
ncbi:MAG: EI24 domain-containing protein [Helicobacter sp.]|nr:EI24 domain-containing protein [Helicobacter sp.]